MARYVDEDRQSLAEQREAGKSPDFAALGGLVREGRANVGAGRPALTAERFEDLIRLTKSPHWVVRGNAMGQGLRLIEAGPAAQKDRFAARAAEAAGDPHWYVREKAAEVLLACQARDRADALVPMLNDPAENNREIARHALRELGHPAASR